MNRRSFVSKGALIATGCMVAGKITGGSGFLQQDDSLQIDTELYRLYMDAPLHYHPFIRWWWNGDKVETAELVRELRLLRMAGIGGVEINPVKFPTRFEGDDLGKMSLTWLSNEWIDMLMTAFSEAKSLGMTCDLIVGSGWPFGGEYLEGEELAQVVVIAVKKITGPLEYRISRDELFIEADPAVSSPYPGRTMELLSLNLVPDPLSRFDQVFDLSDQVEREFISVSIPPGDHALYGLVKVHGFMEVIEGAPGAAGPVLNHYNQDAIRKFLYRMSEAIEKRIGPLSEHIRALFTDSMELEGANWSSDMMDEFEKRRGYDLFPFLPFVLFKTGAMGNITDFNYGARMTPAVKEMVQRMRYDYELTKAELLEERFIMTFVSWCRDLGVKSRMQAYGRGFFPLESSFACDIPECESWTMNWLKHRVGEEMPDEDYRRGRAYTMINKYVSSAAHLTGKRLVSCEEMTDTYTVFNTSLENLKIGGDQSAITGVTHSIFHGFNYSPPGAPYPGWIRYGGYFSEENNWWPYFHLYNDYKARLSSIMQNVTMFADIAILPPLTDMWSIIGAQNEPFPSVTHVEYMTLVWEAINKNGSGCDYVSERVICESEMRDGYMYFGQRRYNTLFLVQVDTLEAATAKKLYDFVSTGGRVFCIETYPSRSPGWKDYNERDKEVRGWINKMEDFPQRFILIHRPERDFISWFRNIQQEYSIIPYIEIDKPDPYVMQTRYQADDGTEWFFIINSHIHDSHKTEITFTEVVIGGKQGWIYDLETGNKYRMTLSNKNSMDLDLGPGDSYLMTFSNEVKGPEWHPLPASGPNPDILNHGWSAEFRHCREISVKTIEMDMLKDLKEMSELVSFSGTIIYRNTFNADKPHGMILNLGKVYGVSEVTVNGLDCGAKWYGRRIFDVGDKLKPGVNTIEVKVVTSMGNYMKSLTDNPIAQYWTNEKTKNQPLQSMGLIGPVMIYHA